MTDQEFIKIGWWLLEQMNNYYVKDTPSVSDEQYDKAVRDYESECKQRGVDVYTTNCIGFPSERPSAQLVRRVR